MQAKVDSSLIFWFEFMNAAAVSDSVGCDHQYCFQYIDCIRQIILIQDSGFKEVKRDILTPRFEFIYIF